MVDRYRHFEPIRIAGKSHKENLFNFKRRLNKATINNNRDIKILHACTSIVNQSQHFIARENMPWNHYYKVSSNILPALLNSRMMGLVAADIRLPYEHVEILLPQGNGIEDGPKGELRSIILWERKSGSAGLTELRFNEQGKPIIEERPNMPFRQLVVQAQWRTYDAREVIEDYGWIGYFCLDDRSLAEVIAHLDSMRTFDSVDAEEGRQEKLGASALVLAIGVCLLATGKHRYIEPDVLTADRQRYLGLQNAEERQEMVERAQEKGIYGNLVGFRYTPVPAAQHDTQETKGPRGPLQFSHWRTGHFRRIPAGEIIWIEPTIVKPNLPPHPQKRQYCVGIRGLRKANR